MIKIHVNKTDPRYIFLTGDNKELKAIESYMNPFIPYTMLPTSKIPPTREIFLEKFKKGQAWIYWCPAGLWKEIVDFCINKKIELDSSAIGPDFKYTNFDMSIEQFTRYIYSWDLNIEPREYQIKAAWLILKYKLSLSELATRAGKTLIFYIIARAMKEKYGIKNILMIVPSVHLVKQGVKDLEEYKEFFSTEQIWAGGEEVILSDLTIGTFQSLIRKADPKYPKTYNPKYFDKFDMVVCDEAHRSPGASIKKILSLDAFKNVKLRFGFTGTLPKPGTIENFACQAMLGPKIQEISARELIDEGFLAEPIITQILIKYEPDSFIDIQNICAEYLLSIYTKDNKGNQILLPKDQRKMTMIHEKKLPYAITGAKKNLSEIDYNNFLIKNIKESTKTLALEQMISTFSEPKIELIIDIIKNNHGNTIIFAHNTEYINYLTTRLKEEFNINKNIHKISGNISIKKRQTIISEMEKSDNNILVASFGCIGTGITLKNINNGIFSQSFKSDTIIRQSLGRLMLRNEEKVTFNLFDLIDIFPNTGKIKSQGSTKRKIYKAEGYNYSTQEINIPFKYIKYE